MDSLKLQLKQFSKAIERSKISQMHNTADMAGNLTEISQYLQDLMELPQTILKAIKSGSFQIAIDLINYFDSDIVNNLQNIQMVSFIKEEIDKLKETLKDKVKETINLKIDAKTTSDLLKMLQNLSPDLSDPLNLCEEYLKLRDSRFAIIFNKSLFSLVQKLPADFTDFSAVDRQNFLIAYINSIEDLPEILIELSKIEWPQIGENKQKWHLEKLISNYEHEHLRKFINSAKNAVISIDDKNRVEVFDKIYKIIEKLKFNNNIDFYDTLHEFCEEHVQKTANLLIENIKNQFIQEIRKGIKQKQVDTQFIASDMPEEIHSNPTYMQFIGHFTNSVKKISYFYTQVKK